MTAPYLPFPVFRGLTTAGLPLAGGLLYTYAAGTSTPQATYGADGVTTNANPVVLDTTGTATIRLQPNLGYKFILKDSGGTTQWTVDNYLPYGADAPVFSGTVTGGSFTTSGTVTATGTVTGSALVPAGSSVPTDGIYLPSSHTVGFASNSLAHGSYNSQGAWIIPAPTSGSGDTLSLTAIAGGSALSITGAASVSVFSARIANIAAAGSSRGLLIQAGGNSSDIVLLIQDRTGSTNFLAVYGDGGVVIGTPTGGNKGAGTLNIQGTLYVNGTAVTVP